MRITKQQAEENRARVIATAARLFRERGFDGVGVADLMHAAGLTHGGFYNHFESKDELEAAACEHALGLALEAIRSVADRPDPKDRAEALGEYKRRYVSRKSRDAEPFRCPMVAFGADVTRQSEPVRKEYAAGLRRYLDAYARAFASERPSAKQSETLRLEALAQFATMVGAVSLARSIASADPALSDEILEAAAAAVEGPKPRTKSRQSATAVGERKQSAIPQAKAIAATNRP